ncbi:MAG TPA: TRAP transporter small permease subunit [Burkholderiales bacterium]|nr:TRAP transporter small permease subunit [Burkholderiales bacterium]
MKHLYARTLEWLAACAAVLLGVTALAITLDVVARNIGLGTLPWILEVSEYVLPLATFLVAPWLLYRNEHVRLDILLNVWPKLGHLCNALGLAVCVVLVVYGVRTILNSADQGAMIFKSVVFPEWWLYVPVPICFALLTIEFVRRMAFR